MSELIAMLNGYLDSKGYPICASLNPDGGDCAADLGTIGFFWFDVTAMSTGVELLALDIPFSYRDDEPLRYWDASMWAGKPGRFSRDQLIPMICGFIGMSTFWEMIAYSYFHSHSRKLFLTAWNTVNNEGTAKSFPANLGDICGPEVWALWIRLYKPWWRHLFLWIFDFQTLIGAIQWRLFTKSSNQLTRNHMLVCLTTMSNSPTITSRLACRINDWQDLSDRWEKCNKATFEYPTYPLFQAKLKILGLIK